MQKKLRKATMLLLAVLIIAATPLYATASRESPDQSMEVALIAVKTLLNIDDNVFTEFNYSSSFSNWETREGLVWTFMWSSADNAFIHVSATAEGTLLQYYMYDYSGRGYGFAEISREAAIAAADAFIRRATPSTSSFYSAPDSVQTNLHSSDYTLFYQAQVNGYAFDAASIWIGVNKFTGEITTYSTRNVDPGRYRFESPAGIITQSAAIAAYADKIGLTLEYRSSFDFDSGRIRVFPIYRFSSQWDTFIGAVTGDIVTYVYDLGTDDAVTAGGAVPAPAMESEADSAGGRASLTAAERAAIEQVAGFLSSEEALKTLLDAADISDLDTASFDAQHISLNRDWLNRDRYFYDISLNRWSDFSQEDEIGGVWGRVDAATGRVLSFNFYYSGTPMRSEPFTEQQATAAVDAFLNRMAPGELASARLESTSTPWGNRFGSVVGDYSFSYVRYANDTPFRDNGINVTYNPHTGRITSYSLNWFENISFPSVAGVLSQQQALQTFVGQNGSTVRYVTTGGGNASLIYDFGSHHLIDPFSGRALDYMGEPWTDTAVTPAYDDVIGHWSEYYVMKLLNNGVFMWGGRFDPDRVMTELEFLQYISLIDGVGPMPRMELQAYFARRGVTVEARADRNLTRQEAARIIVEFLGYAGLAEQPEFFIYPFTDNVDAAYRGHITICYMLGIVSGNNGRFDPLHNVTRAHAAVLLHNLIQARS